MGGHRPGRVGEIAERCEIARRQGRQVRFDHRQRLVAVHRGATMAGNMLDDRRNAPGMQGVHDDPAQGCNRIGFPAQRPVADDRISPGLRQVENRPAIDGDVQVRQVFGDGLGVLRQRRRGPRRVGQIHLGKLGSRRPFRPMRRAQTLHPPAFLIDQHRRGGIADRGAQVADQCPDLIRSLDIAGEQDEAQRVGFFEKAFLVVAKRRSRAAEDRRPGRAVGAVHHLPGAMTRHPCPRLDRLAQTARAWVLSPAGPRRMR